MTHSLTLEITDTVYRKLRQWSKAEGKTVEDFVSDALEGLLEDLEDIRDAKRVKGMKRKDVSDEMHYLIVFPDDEHGGRAIDLLVKDGKVYSVLYGGEACVIASESQLKRLTRAGIKWSYATGRKGEDIGAAPKTKRSQSASVRSTRHRRCPSTS